MGMSNNAILDMLYKGTTTIQDFNWEQMNTVPILYLMTPEDINSIKNLILSPRYSGNNKLKMERIDEIMHIRGFSRFAGGTNRLVYIHPSAPNAVFKVAIDSVGINDNPAEFRNQQFLKPYCCKVFECSPCGTIASFEKVDRITTFEEFYTIADDIFYIISRKIIGKYVMEDIGIDYFMNFGCRRSFGPVVLDFPYLFELDGRKLECSSILDDGSICHGEIDYDSGFNKLICKKCGRTYRARDLAKPPESGGILLRERGGRRMKLEIKIGDNVIKTYDTTIERDHLSKHDKEVTGKVKVTVARGNSDLKRPEINPIPKEILPPTRIAEPQTPTIKVEDDKPGRQVNISFGKRNTDVIFAAVEHIDTPSVKVVIEKPTVVEEKPVIKPITNKPSVVVETSTSVASKVETETPSAPAVGSVIDVFIGKQPEIFKAVESEYIKVAVERASADESSMKVEKEVAYRDVSNDLDKAKAKVERASADESSMKVEKEVAYRDVSNDLDKEKAKAKVVKDIIEEVKDEISPKVEVKEAYEKAKCTPKAEDEIIDNPDVTPMTEDDKKENENLIPAVTFGDDEEDDTEDIEAVAAAMEGNYDDSKKEEETLKVSKVPTEVVEEITESNLDDKEEQPNDEEDSDEDEEFNVVFCKKIPDLEEAEEDTFYCVANDQHIDLASIEGVSDPALVDPTQFTIYMLIGGEFKIVYYNHDIESWAYIERDSNFTPGETAPMVEPAAEDEEADDGIPIDGDHFDQDSYIEAIKQTSHKQSIEAFLGN